MTLPGVVIVDDDADIRALMEIRCSLQSRFRLIGAVGDLTSALQLIGTTTVTAVLLDWHLGSVCGKAFLAQLARDHPEVRTIVYSADPSAQQEAMQLGAAAFVLKGWGQDPLDVVAAVVDPAA